MTTLCESGELSTDVSTQSRKRKVDQLLASLDRSKFIPSAPKRASTCAPWDRTSLSDRLLTFRGYENHSVASPLNALSLASKGWAYLGTRTIECINCHEQVVLDMSTTMTGIYKELEQAYVQMIDNGHRKTCLWSTRECSPTLLRVPISDASMSLEAFEKRKNSFLDSKIRVDRPSESTGDGDPSQWQALESSERLAVFGWSLVEVEGLRMLTCETCHRRMLFKENEDISVRSEHYEYCPWISSATQGSIPASEALLQHYVKRHSTRSTKSPRSILDGEETTRRGHERDLNEEIRNTKRKLGFLFS